MVKCLWVCVLGVVDVQVCILYYLGTIVQASTLVLVVGAEVWQTTSKSSNATTVVFIPALDTFDFVMSPRSYSPPCTYSIYSDAHVLRDALCVRAADMCNNAMLFSEESYWHIINRFIFGFQLLWSLFYTLNLHLYLVALIYLHQIYFCVDVPLWVDKWIRTTVPNSMQHIYRFTYWYCMNHSLRSNHDRCDSLSLTAFHQTKGASVLWRKNLCSFEGFHPECSPSPLISIYLLYNYCIFFYSLVCNNGSNLWSGAHTDERGSQGRETRNKHRERREDIILFCNTCTTRWHFCRYNTVLPPNSCEVIGEASRRSITQSPMFFL